MAISKRRRKAEAAIDECLLAVVHIACDRCGKKNELSTLTGDTDEAASFFYDEGWRADEQILFCKKCRRLRVRG